jgi:hypothetical protein
MDLIYSNNFNSNKLDFTSPSDLLSKVIQMLKIIPNLLEDYEKNYVLYNTFPNNDEYTRIYETSKSNLEKMNSELFLLNNNIEKNTNDITLSLLEFNKKITQLKEQNGKTKIKLNSIEDKYNGSKILIEDYKEMYNNQYFKNFTILIGVILSGTILTQVFVFRKKPSL